MKTLFFLRRILHCIAPCSESCGVFWCARMLSLLWGPQVPFGGKPGALQEQSVHRAGTVQLQSRAEQCPKRAL